MEVATHNDTALRKFRKAWNKAWRRLKGLKPAARAILDALFLRLGNDLFCRPSQATIAEDAGLSERTVQRWLPILEKQGWIRREERICKRGRLTDRYHIRTPDCPDITTIKVDQEPTRQNSGGCPDKMAERKGTSGKPKETSSLAARTAASARPLPEHLIEFTDLWRELLGKAPMPDMAWLDTYSPRVTQTAFAVLIERKAGGQIRYSAKGLFRKLIADVHGGGVQLRAYTPNQLRRIAAGVLPEHTHKVRKQPAPEVPDEPQKEEAPPKSSTKQQPPVQPPTKAAPNPAKAIVEGHPQAHWKEVCAALRDAALQGQIHALDAIDALNKAWGWSPLQAEQAIAVGGAS